MDFENNLDIEEHIVDNYLDKINSSLNSSPEIEYYSEVEEEKSFYQKLEEYINNAILLIRERNASDDVYCLEWIHLYLIIYSLKQILVMVKLMKELVNRRNNEFEN